VTRIGVFGGEFDPPHLGHLAVLRAARDQLGLDRVLVVPVGVPPHRAASTTPAAVRLEMVEEAFGGEPGVEVTSMEIDRPGASYTVDTLEQLASQGRLFLIIGADQLAALDSWRDADRIRELATLVVAPRDGFAVDPSEATPLEMPAVDVSSRALRDDLAGGRTADDALDPAVASLIRTRGLYG
jgi:nicotinate-nucleotide adenylyltransferase